MPSVIVRPPSKTSSTASHDDIPPQPLDQNQHEAVFIHPPSSHDTPVNDNCPHSPETAGPNHHGPEELAFHKLPVEVISRYALLPLDVTVPGGPGLHQHLKPPVC